MPGRHRLTPADPREIEELYKQGLSILKREFRCLGEWSRREGKLTPGQARDLRDYLKLLRDLKADAEEVGQERKASEVQTKTDEELLATIVEVPQK